MKVFTAIDGDGHDIIIDVSTLDKKKLMLKKLAELTIIPHRYDIHYNANEVIDYVEEDIASMPVALQETETIKLRVRKRYEEEVAEKKRELEEFLKRIEASDDDECESMYYELYEGHEIAGGQIHWGTSGFFSRIKTPEEWSLWGR